MFSSLKSGLLAVVVSAVALLAVVHETSSITIDPAAAATSDEASQFSTMPGQLDALERDIHDRSVDELRLEAEGDESFARGICSINCRPCTSSSQCLPFDGQPQVCVFGQICP